MKNIKKQIQDLRKKIKRHNHLYYTLNKPEISDSEYDRSAKELERLEEQYPGYMSPDSPTQKIGAPVQAGFARVRHAAPMLSLGSVSREEECVKFDRTCKKELGTEEIDYVCEPKLDGLSVELVYERGIFVRGVTRGDGFAGEEVTENLKTVKNIPQRLKGDKVPRHFSVRGEVLMHITDFQELNKKQTEAGKDAFANPRNAAAGSLRQHDPRITAERELDIYCYRILALSEEMPSTQEEMLHLISKLGLKTAPGVRHCSAIEEAVRYHHELEKKRDELDYEIDGVVVKVNSLDHQRRLGTRTANPRWALAFKFEPRKEVTRVENIVVQVGRTGVLTPVALLQPVEVGGVTVSRATLHNMDEVARLDVKIGDHVKVQRAGDVIPDITEVIADKRTGREKVFHMPGDCPSCGTPVKKEDVYYRCPAGLACPAQIKEAIAHYVSKGAVDIDGFSDKTAGQLYEEGLINRISDIYALRKEDLLKLEGWKEKKAVNLLRAIEDSKDVTLDRFIFGLGIRNVGKHIAAVLADEFGALARIIAVSMDELVAIKEIGPGTAENVVSFFAKDKNIQEIEKLVEQGVSLREKGKKGRLAGKKIVFTGSLQTMSRSEAGKLVESEGGEACSGVSETTDLVVAGEKPGSKFDTAREKSIKIISEAEFKKLLEA